MKISVVVPAYNEERIIGKMLNTYREFLRKSFDEYELILVDDGSTDNTRRIAMSCKDVTCISYKKNRGKGYAVKRGFLRATGDYIFFTDADLSYPPQYIGCAVEMFRTTATEAVVGVRAKKDREYTFFRRVLSDIFAKVVGRIISTSVTDTQCGFKGFEKAAGKQIFSKLRIFDFGFDLEVIYLSEAMGKTISPMPVSFNHRRDTRVRYIRDGFRAVRDLIYIKRSNEYGIIKKSV